MNEKSSSIVATPEYKDKKLFGRRWKISVLVPLADDDANSKNQQYTSYILSNSDYEDQSLHVTFNIQKFGWTCPNFSEIAVYNLKRDLANLIIKQGAKVLVEAGYKNGNYGQIYFGTVFQPLWEREDNVSFKLTFRCIDAMGLIYDNFVSTSLNALGYQKDMVAAMASQANNSFSITRMSDGVVNNQLARGKIFFGSPMHYVRKLAQQSGTVPSVIDDMIIIDRPQDTLPAGTEKNAIVISPNQGGLIGTPQQTQNGVNFTCLLNPAIKVFTPTPMLVKLDNTYIRQMALQYNTEGFSRLDQDYMYRVIGVEHSGDTRGTSWYTKVTGANQDMEGTLPAMFQTQDQTVK